MGFLLEETGLLLKETGKICNNSILLLLPTSRNKHLLSLISHHRQSSNA